MYLKPHTARNGTVIHVIQGEFRVSRKPGEVMSTILGSCVATCMWDPAAKVGGMNHFLLAEGENLGEMGYRYGLQAMELLVNGLIKIGADKRHLQAKLFGGARMQRAFGRIGEANAEFARQFLASENIRCVAESLGGTQARRIRFVPTTGQARQLVLEGEVPQKPARAGGGGDVTLF